MGYVIAMRGPPIKYILVCYRWNHPQWRLLESMITSQLVHLVLKMFSNGFILLFVIRFESHVLTVANS